MRFKDFVTYTEELKYDLYENSLYKDATERTDLLNDKQKVAEAFLFNFIGILGMLNGNTHTRDAAMLRKYFMSDKKLRIDTIGDENNDMSLVIKLAKDADFFKNDTVVQQITRFLAKVKLGQITAVDSKIIGGWMKNLKPEFIRYIKEPQLRAEFELFQKDGGETIDISRLAVLLKKKMKILTMGGEFVPFAKRFKIVEKTPADIAAIIGPVTPSATVPDDVTATTTDGDGIIPADGTGQKRIRRTKAQMAATMATMPPVIPSAVVDPPSFPDERKLDVMKLFTFGFFDGTISNAEYLEKYSNLKLTSKEKEIIEKTRNEVLPLLKSIFHLDVSSVSKEIEKICQIVNNAKFTSTELISDIFISRLSYTNSRYDFGLDVDKMYMSILAYCIVNIELGRQLEYNPFAMDIYSENIFDMTMLIYNSNLSVKPKLLEELITAPKIKAIFSSISFSMYSDGISNKSQNKIAQLLLKVSTGNYTIESIYNEVKEYYAARHPFWALLRKDYRRFTYTMLYGVDLIRVFKNLMDTVNQIRITDDIFKPLWSCFMEMKNDQSNEIIDYMREKFANDIVRNGFGNSILNSMGVFEYQSVFRIKNIAAKLGIDYDYIVKKFPRDHVLVNIEVEANGLDNVDIDVYKEMLTKQVVKDLRNYNKIPKDKNPTDEDFINTTDFADTVAKRMPELYRRSSDTSKVVKVLINFMKEKPAMYDTSHTFGTIMKLLPKMDRDDVLAIARIAKENNFKEFFKGEQYTNISRRDEKAEYVNIFTGIMNDAIGTDVEDYISDILEQMPGGVIGKIKGTLVGFNNLVSEVNSGEIKPFGTIDDKRLRVMLSMNDINLGAIVTAEMGRKKKGEKWADYFKRVKADSGKSNKKILGLEKVDLDPVADVKALTKTYNSAFRSGKHGDVYTKITKVYNSNLEFPEFKEFRKNNFGDGTITPAFHGTGGIAATMILRYGFKVIKSTDSSVVGRMLGDGIYFSNKLDKAMQYVGNGGFGRYSGEEGYILEIDNNLGRKATTSEGPDYRVMGLGNDNIRSPEWCVRDPKKQLAVRKVYQVERTDERGMKKYLNEENSGTLGFKDYLKENKLMKMNTGAASFIFRDGLIPIFKRNEEGELKETFVDFEDVLAQKLIPASFIDYSMQGPVVIFDNVDETFVSDNRFAESLNGEEFRKYRAFFLEQVLNEKL